jgi:hypothetical protein
MSTPQQNSISFKFEPWVLFTESPDGAVSIEQSFATSAVRLAKNDRIEIASEQSPNDTKQLFQDIHTQAKNLLGDSAPTPLGFYAVAVDAPEHPAIHNKGLHVFFLSKTVEGNLLAIPYGNSIGNELVQAQTKRPDLNVNPDDVNSLITASFNWMLQPEGGNVKTIGVAFDYDKHAASYRNSVPGTYQLFAGVDATGESKKYTDREYDVLHAYWRGAQEIIGKPEAQGSGSIVYLLEAKDALSYFFAEENTALRAWVYEIRHLIQGFEATHKEVRATPEQRLENMGNAAETLTAYLAAQQATH